jgi:hypothetical protein
VVKKMDRGRCDGSIDKMCDTDTLIATRLR